MFDLQFQESRSKETLYYIQSNQQFTYPFQTHTHKQKYVQMRTHIHKNVQICRYTYTTYFRPPFKVFLRRYFKSQCSCDNLDSRCPNLTKLSILEQICCCWKNARQKDHLSLLWFFFIYLCHYNTYRVWRGS